MLSQSCEILPGVGPALVDKLSRCGIKTIGDLIFHLPYRYQDRTRITPIQDLRPNEYCVIVGQICKIEVKYGKRTMLDCYVQDKTSGLLRLRFFHFNKQQLHTLKTNTWLRAFGEVREFANQFAMIHPEYRILANEQDITVDETLTPIYPTTEGLTQSRLRQLIKLTLTEYQLDLEQLEWMSHEQLQAYTFPSLAKAITFLHNPSPDTTMNTLEEGTHPALQRMIFDELLAQRLSMQFARQYRSQFYAPSLLLDEALINQFISQLPFKLTEAQLRVSQEISQDLVKDKPMLRLIQGDVGCGKTTVAALAALQAIGQGYQVALMAPTDLLSEQHALNLQKWFAPLGIKCARLSGKMKLKERREILGQLVAHDCQLVIGTHALFQEGVEFSRLGLIIIDEQHRFGVEQRLLLQQKGQYDQCIPHQLLMTATPIPRTLAMTQFAHLDISIIDTLPPGRVPVHTAVVNQAKRDQIIERLQTAIAKGMQAYWVCTLIEESEKLQCTAASLTAKTLQEQLPDVRVGLVHGKMKALEKEAVMGAFKEGELNLLVATTVIEVGVDVPNASLMIIENAERLGLSQLHQLRGRVGRGNNQSYCLLLYQSPLSELGAERLQIMRATSDGFVIAEKDLQLRGAGEFLGTKQTGYRQFKIANLHRDHALLPQVSNCSNHLINHDPEKARLIAERWLGEFEQFLQS
ncbi:ATP-dependent DNA helicase RecG [Legionella beliardensis]|uniref:ATP-dependent DNA helicase RecG n=1 Tax=Legionella beliardensis TaxID=91822 RepID=A0A378I052_9GAMM|nr:ATP-dependent DNA helicase RecG [Legionella beliardensis]STX28090.1 ATP-dependent DNA helicase RecG [Legionella beliardensis]